MPTRISLRRVDSSTRKLMAVPGSLAELLENATKKLKLRRLRCGALLSKIVCVQGGGERAAQRRGGIILLVRRYPDRPTNL